MRKTSHPEMTNWKRRRILQSVGAIAAVTTAGCPGDFPKRRVLQIRRVERLNDGGDAYRFRISVDYASTGGSEEWQRLHNVTLVGYSDSASGRVLCEAHIGTIEGNSSGLLEPIIVECDEYPDVFTFEADESVCEDDTRVTYAIRRTADDGAPYRLDQFREC